MKSKQSQTDASKVERLWSEAKPLVSAYVFSVISNFHTAEDVIQQVAMTVVSKFETYDPSRPFSAWARGISRFKILQYFQKHQSELPLLDPHALELLQETHDRLEPEWEEMKAALKHCSAQLKPRAQEVLTLRYGNNMKPKFIGSKLGMTPTAVTSLLHRVRSVLRNCIQKRIRREDA